MLSQRNVLGEPKRQQLLKIAFIRATSKRNRQKSVPEITTEVNEHTMSRKVSKFGHSKNDEMFDEPTNLNRQRLSTLRDHATWEANNKAKFCFYARQ